MKNTIKMTVLSLIAAFSVFTSNASTNDSLFNANEFSLTIGSSYGLDDGEYDGNLSVGVSYSFTKNFLLEAEVPVYQERGTSVDRVSFGLGYRYPVARIFAPGVRVGSSYLWNDEHFTGYAGFFVETKINKKWAIVPGIDYVFTNFDKFDKGDWLANVKLKLTF